MRGGVCKLGPPPLGCVVHGHKLCCMHNQIQGHVHDTRWQSITIDAIGTANWRWEKCTRMQRWRMRCRKSEWGLGLVVGHSLTTVGIQVPAVGDELTAVIEGSSSGWWSESGTDVPGSRATRAYPGCRRNI